MDLFGHTARRERRGQPLAERMRPQALAEFVGQAHLLGEGKLLGRLLGARDLPSLLLWGPPGTGKTTLARLIARERRARFVPLSAVTAGVAQIREVVAAAGSLRDERDERTILFLDEIHRFNKGQQDALLPHVEEGTVTLVGATTENPSFEINAALLSRCTLVRLESLGAPDLRALLDRALADPARGLGALAPVVPAHLRDRIAELAEGDARRALGVLELAVSVAAARGGDGPPEVDEAAVDEAAQGRTLRYDKAGEEHYNLVSALIKSMRGSDPDAAVYWMVRMLEGGEDPLFVARRLVIFAAEDIGNADPQALLVAQAAAQAVHLVGLPEGTLPLTQAVIHLAAAPKSNSTLLAYARARKATLERGSLAVPPRLRNAPTRLMKELGFSRGYKYPHDFEGNYVPERYLPDELAGERFYTPSDNGAERAIAARLAAWEERRQGLTPAAPEATEK